MRLFLDAECAGLGMTIKPPCGHNGEAAIREVTNIEPAGRQGEAIKVVNGVNSVFVTIGIHIVTFHSAPES